MRPIQILIVEDEAIIAMGIAHQLTRAGYQVSAIVATGEEAIQIARQNPPDIAIVDKSLAGKLDGMETIEQIRAFSQLPAIFFTGDISETVTNRIKTLQPAAQITKPAQAKEIIQSIEKLLARGTAQA